MTHGLYTVRDKVAEQCGPVFQAINDGIARRGVVQMMRKVAEYDRSSFELLKVANFDDSKGLIEALDEPEVISVEFPKFEDVGQRKFGFEEE